MHNGTLARSSGVRAAPSKARATDRRSREVRTLTGPPHVPISVSGRACLNVSGVAPVRTDHGANLLHGDCLEQLKSLESNSVDSLVTDPPAGISFMGKDWDGDKGGRKQWIVWMTEVMSECMRVLKPGAHGLVWALPRTSHWTATALEDAGFEVRDVVTHLFGSGFPKSLDVSKAIDKAAGAKREVLSTRKLTGKARVLKGGNFDGGYEGKELNDDYAITAPATDDAKKWAGFGTALKPASEHWILVRKPCSEKTVAANVLKWGTGALNIDASRVAGAIESGWSKSGSKASNNLSMSGANTARPPKPDSTQGRFPANLVLSHSLHCTDAQCDIECAILALDEQSGTLKSGQLKPGHKRGDGHNVAYGGGGVVTGTYGGDSGGASRFFYCAKISKSERNAGCETGETRHMSTARLNSGDKSGKFPDHDTREKTGNHHPTVKPKKLMAYLIRMVTPPGGVTLDPFMGSGSTGIAAKECGFDFIGIERDAEYHEIASKRIESAVSAGDL